MNRVAVNARTMLELLGPQVEAMGYELVDVDCRTGGRDGLLRLYIDHADGAGGVGLDDCERVSLQVSALLDVEDPMPGRYTLEVSSPGLDRRLRTPAHFRRFVGREIRVELGAPCEGRRRFRGELLEVRDADIVMRVDGEPVVLAMGDMESARLVPEL